MRIYCSLIWSVVASLTSQNVVPRSADPVADVCSPLCSDETALALEEECGELLGCPELDLGEDPDVILACWSPCFAAVEDCFNLCAERFDDILQMCYNDCGQQENPVDCIAVCFNASFMDFRNGLQQNQDNSTGDTSSEVREPPEVDTAQTPTLTLNSQDVSIEMSEDIDIAMPTTDLDIESPLHRKYMHNTRFNLNDTLKLYMSLHNNATNMDVSDSNKVMKVDTFLSRLFPYIIYNKLRILKKTHRSDKNNRGLQRTKQSQHREITNHHMAEGSSSTTPSLQSLNNTNHHIAESSSSVTPSIQSLNNSNHHIAEGSLSTTPSLQSPDNEAGKSTLSSGADFLNHRTTRKQRGFHSWVRAYNKIIEDRYRKRINRSRRNVYKNFLQYKTDNKPSWPYTKLSKALKAKSGHHV